MRNIFKGNYLFVDVFVASIIGRYAVLRIAN